MTWEVIDFYCRCADGWKPLQVGEERFDKRQKVLECEGIKYLEIRHNAIMHGKDVLHLCMHYFCFVCNVIHGSGALNYIYKIFHKCACCQNSYTFFFFLKSLGLRKNTLSYQENSHSVGFIFWIAEILALLMRLDQEWTASDRMSCNTGLSAISFDRFQGKVTERKL